MSLLRNYHVSLKFLELWGKTRWRKHWKTRVNMNPAKIGYLFVTRNPRLMIVHWMQLTSAATCGGNATQTVSHPLFQEKTWNKRSSMLRRSESSERLHAQDVKLCLIIVVWKTSNFRQEIRQSHYRNDPVKYDLKHLMIEGAYMTALSQTLPLGYDFS